MKTAGGAARRHQTVEILYGLIIGGDDQFDPQVLDGFWQAGLRQHAPVDSRTHHDDLRFIGEQGAQIPQLSGLPRMSSKSGRFRGRAARRQFLRSRE